MKKSLPLAVAMVLAAPAPTPAAEAEAIRQLIARLRGGDEQARYEAWQSAPRYGAPAVKPLADLMADSDVEVARAARQGLRRIVHHVGRPGAAPEARAVEAELRGLLKHMAAEARREALWLLSEIAGTGSVGPMAELLRDAAVGADACMALQRLPGPEVIRALRAALKSLPEECRPAVAEALRRRGESVSVYPSQKLTPTRTTSLKAA